MKKNVVLGSILGIVLCSGLVFAGGPAAPAGQMNPGQDISARRHPNLAAAQRHFDQAFEKISAAQAANEWDMEGHAAKAKELIDQASRELKAAAEASNRHR